MAKDLASQFLEELTSNNNGDNKFTTIIDGDVADIVHKWQGSRSKKQTVHHLIRIADEYLSERQGQQAVGATKS